MNTEVAITLWIGGVTVGLLATIATISMVAEALRKRRRNQWQLPKKKK